LKISEQMIRIQFIFQPYFPNKLKKTIFLIFRKIVHFLKNLSKLVDIIYRKTKFKELERFNKVNSPL
jgi:hypothetical protein